MNALLARCVELAAGADRAGGLLIKLTLLLAFAWLLHASLARANPRWRVLVWRGSAALSLLVLLLALFGPAISLAVLPANGKGVFIAAEIPRSPIANIDSGRERSSAITANAPLMPSPLNHDNSSAVPAQVKTVEAAFAANAKPVESPWTLANYAAAVWGVGVLIGGVLELISVVRLGRLRRRAVPAAANCVEQAAQIAAKLHWRKPFDVLITTELATPCVIGVWRPAILLSGGPGRLSDDELAAVFAHEIQHLKNADLPWNAVLRVASRLAWFHPLAWRMRAAHASACDAVCDAVAADFLGDVTAYCRTLARLALRAAAPLPAAGLAMARTSSTRRRIEALHRRLYASCLPRWRVLFAIICGLTGAGLLGATSLTRAANGVDEQQSPVQQPASAGATSATTQEVSPVAIPSDKEAAPEPYTYRGRVVDFDGNPVEGARVYLAKTNHPAASHWLAEVEPVQEMYGRATADAAGSFSLKCNDVWSRAKRAPELDRLVASGVALVAVAKEHAPAWIAAAKAPDDGSLVFRLERNSTPLAGCVIDLEGRPIAGVQVTLKALYDAAPGAVDNWLAELPKLREQGFLPQPGEEQSSAFGGRPTPKGQFPHGSTLYERAEGLPHRTVTGPDGRFRFDQLGSNRLALLTINGPGIAQEWISVVTRTMSPVAAHKVDGRYYARIRDNIYFGAESDIVAAPSLPIAGVVRDKDTQRPLAGVRIAVFAVAKSTIGGSRGLAATTDAEGRYRLEGLPIGKGSELEVTPVDKPYFTTRVKVPDGQGGDGVQFDIELKRGLWITGRLTEKGTGKPVSAKLQYYPLLTNERARDYANFSRLSIPAPSGDGFHTDRDGKYRIVGISGKAVLAAQADQRSEYLPAALSPELRAIYDEKRQTLKTYDLCLPLLLNALGLVDVPADAETAEFDLEADGGTSIDVALIDPAGDPLSGVRMDFGVPLQESHATIGKIIAGRAKVIEFMHVQRSLGRVVAIDGVPHAGTLSEVKLLPLAAVVGRFVNADGGPVDRGLVRLDFTPEKVARGAGNVVRVNEYSRVQAGADGRFRAIMLPDGVYDVVTSVPAKPFVPLMKDVMAKAGEEIDVGDIDAKTGLRLSQDPPTHRAMGPEPAKKSETK